MLSSGKDTSNRNKSEENSNENKNKLIISPIFATEILVSFVRCYGRMVKRESGVNPEQTRCCKLRQKFSYNTQIHCLALERWEGR